MQLLLLKITGDQVTVGGCRELNEEDICPALIAIKAVKLVTGAGKHKFPIIILPPLRSAVPTYITITLFSGQRCLEGARLPVDNDKLLITPRRLEL